MADDIAETTGATVMGDNAQVSLPRAPGPDGRGPRAVRCSVLLCAYCCLSLSLSLPLSLSLSLPLYVISASIFLLLLPLFLRPLLVLLLTRAAPQGEVVHYGDKIELWTQSHYCDVYSVEPAPPDARLPPGPVGYYSKQGRHGVLR